MAFLNRARKLLSNAWFFEKQRDIMEDRAKILMICPQAFIGLVNLWPVNATFIKKMMSISMVAIELLHMATLLVYLTLNIGDMEKSTGILSSMGASVQSIIKAVLILHKSKDVKKLIDIVRYEFLPSNIISRNSESRAEKFSNVVFTYLIVQYSTALLSRILCVLVPLLETARTLPYTTWFPFEWSRTPVYQIIYILQSWIGIYVDVNVVVGYDALYNAICTNCVVQFQLLKEAIERIGTGNEKKLAEKLSKIPGLNYEPIGKGRDKRERRLLVLCAKHHQKLLHVCDELNRIFGEGYVLQFCATLVGICPTCYQISQFWPRPQPLATYAYHLNAIHKLGPRKKGSSAKGGNSNNSLMLLTYCVAHMVELFLYCAVSNELSYSSVSLSDAAYECLWYKEEHQDIRRYLLFVMMRSQRAISMNAFGLFVLNYISYLSIVRFSFSLYTLLSKMTN